MGWLADAFDWYHDNGIIPNLWKGFTGQKSAEKQNAQNLAYQRDLLDYQKQLQQQIFAREDTAFSRAYEDASKYGINPMSIAGNSAQAGSPVPMSAPTSNVDYSAFSGLRGLDSAMTALGTASQVSSAVNEFKTGNIQRDLLRSEQMKAKLENALFAFENGLIVNDDGSISVSEDSPLLKKTIQEAEVNSKKASTEGQKTTNKRNERVLNYQERTGTTDATPDKVHVVTSGADIASQKLKENINSPSSEADAVARAETEKMADISLSDMWNDTKKMIDEANEKKKNKKPGFFRRYLKYRFGF